MWNKIKESKVIHSKWLLGALLLLSVGSIALGIAEIVTTGYHFNINGMRVEVSGRFARIIMMLPGFIGLLFSGIFLISIGITEKRFGSPFDEDFDDYPEDGSRAHRPHEYNPMKTRRVANIICIVIIFVALCLLLISVKQDYGIKVYEGTATVGDDINYWRDSLSGQFPQDELENYLKTRSAFIKTPDDIRDALRTGGFI